MKVLLAFLSLLALAQAQFGGFFDQMFGGGGSSSGGGGGGGGTSGGSSHQSQQRNNPSDASHYRQQFSACEFFSFPIYDCSFTLEKKEEK